MVTMERTGELEKESGLHLKKKGRLVERKGLIQRKRKRARGVHALVHPQKVYWWAEGCEWEEKGWGAGMEEGPFEEWNWVGVCNY